MDPTGGNDSMATDGNYACFRHFFIEKHILTLARIVAKHVAELSIT